MDVYTIVEIGWEYNDEYYYTHDGDSGQPLAVYKNRATAEKVCLAHNIQRYKEIANSKWAGIDSYFVDWDFSDIEDEREALEELGVTFDDKDHGAPKLPQSASDDEWGQIVGLMGIVFYKLETLEFVE